MPTQARTYSSTRRSEQAAVTRRRIAAAARRLFVARGFDGTTIEMIAQKAGVATPTVYATYGSKRAILMHLMDDVVDKETLDAIAAEDDPRKQVRLVVAFDMRLYAEAADVLAAARAAGTHDRVFGKLRIEGEARRRRGQAGLVRSWAERGALRKGLTETEGADILWAMSSDQLYTLFVRDNGWTVERYESWLSATLESLLFA